MSSVLARLKPLWEHLFETSVATFVAGVLLVLISEFGDVHETRIFGAGAIVTGALGLGTYVGLGAPGRYRVPAWLTQWRSAIAVIATVLVVAPAVVVLLGLLAGAFGDADGERDGLVNALGVLVGLLMLAATLATSILSIRVALRAANEPPETMGEAGEDSEK